MTDIRFDDQKKSYLVDLTGKELKESCEIAWNFCKFFHWANASPEELAYRQGLMNTPEDPYKVERIGVYGEMAVSLITGWPMDKKVRMHGNEWDFVHNGFKVDIKTHFGYYHEAAYIQKKYGAYFIKATNGKGELGNLKSDFYLFCNISLPKFRRDEYNAQLVQVEVVGAIDKNRVLENADERRSRAFWGNFEDYYVKKSEMIRIADFIKMINESRKES